MVRNVRNVGQDRVPSTQVTSGVTQSAVFTSPQHRPATRVSPNIMGTRNGDLYVYVFYGESLTSLCVPHNAYFRWN